MSSRTHSTFYPWLVISLAASFLFYKYILQVSPSVMTSELMQAFDLNATSLGLLAAMFYYPYMITQIVVGPLLDKFSTRALTACAMALCGLGAILFSFPTTFQSALLARALMGTGAAFATVSYLKLTVLWFDARHHALINGFLATAAMAGSISGQVVLAYGLKVVGWQSSMYYAGLLGLVLASLLYLFTRDRKDHVDSDGCDEKPSLKLHDILGVFTKKHNWYLMLYSGFAFAPLAVLGGLWGNPFLSAAYGVGKQEAAGMMSMAFLGLAIGGPVFGWLSDRWQKRYEPMMIGLLLSLLSLVVVIYFTVLTPIFASVFLFLFGFGTGAFMLGFALGKEMNILAVSATVVGFINTGDAFFIALCEPLVGAVLDYFWQGELLHNARVFEVADYQLGFLPLFLMMFGAVILLLRLWARASTDNKVAHNG